MKVLPIKREHIYHVWDRVKDQVALALELGMMTDKPEFDVEYIHQKLLEGKMELMVAIDDTGAIHGSVVISYSDYPNVRIAYVVALAGKGLCTQALWQEVIKLVKDNGATKIQGHDRPAMVRLLKRLGMMPRYTVMEISL